MNFLAAGAFGFSVGPSRSFWPSPKLRDEPYPFLLRAASRSPLLPPVHSGDTSRSRLPPPVHSDGSSRCRHHLLRFHGSHGVKLSNHRPLSPNPSRAGFRLVGAVEDSCSVATTGRVAAAVTGAVRCCSSGAHAVGFWSGDERRLPCQINYSRRS